MADDDLLIRAALRDELSGPLRTVQQEVRSTRREVERLNRSQTTAGRGVTGLGRQVDGLGKRLSRVGDSVSGLSSRLSRGLVTGAKAAGLALGAVVVGLGAFGVKTAASLEVSRVGLEKLTGSAAEAGKLFAFLRELDPKAPFDIQQLQQAALFLGNAGVTGEALRKTLQGTVDVAALAPDRFDDIARAVSQISGAGSLLTQDLNQLVQAGAPVNEALKKAFGVSFAEFRKQQEGGGGQFSSDTFLTALFGVTQGRAETIATNTLTGLLSSVRSRVQQKLSDAASPLVKALKSSLPAIESGIGTILDTLGPPVFTLLGQIAELITKALPVLGPVLAGIATAVGRLFAAAGPALLALEPVMVDLSDALVELVDALVPVMPELVRAFVAMVGVLPDFVRLLAALVPILDPMARLVTALLGFGPVRGIMAGLLAVLIGYNALAGPIRSVWAMVTAMRALAGAQALAGAGGAAGAAGGAAGAARFAMPLMGAAGAHSSALAVGALGTAAGVGVAAAGGALIGTHISRSRVGHGMRDWIGDRLGTGTLAEGATTAASVRANLASSRAPTGVTSSTNVGSIVINSPRSELDVKRAVIDGLTEAERNKAERAAAGARG